MTRRHGERAAMPDDLVGALANRGRSDPVLDAARQAVAGAPGEPEPAARTAPAEVDWMDQILDFAAANAMPLADAAHSKSPQVRREAAKQLAQAKAASVRALSAAGRRRLESKLRDHLDSLSAEERAKLAASDFRGVPEDRRELLASLLEEYRTADEWGLPVARPAEEDQQLVDEIEALDVEGAWLNSEVDEDEDDDEGGVEARMDEFRDEVQDDDYFAREWQA
jgi:hypothetical protein